MIPNIENLNVGSTTLKSASTNPLEPGSLPGMLPASKNVWDPDKFRVRYQKLNLDDASDIIELETIETKALRNRGVYILSKKDFLFMDKIFMLVTYIEEVDAK